jgi:hypothetical protein
MLATIDDPAILDEIGSAMKGRGVGVRGAVFENKLTLLDLL